MPRSIWKGAISFGLVHIPVELFPSHNAQSIDLDMLDRRDFAPIGFKRYNKVTGKDVKPEDIVKGYEFEKGEYVVLTDSEIKKANVKSTQTIDIVAFVDEAEISPLYFEQPYYLKPGKGGDKVYSLLRQTLYNTSKIGIAQVVIRTKQHLAALMPIEDAIVLNMLRYAEEIRPADELALPKTNDKNLRLTDKELRLANSLVNEMTEKWDPSQFHDTFREDLMALVRTKIKNRQTHILTEPEEGDANQEQPASNVVDLMALLKNSLGKRVPGTKAVGTNKAKNQVSSSEPLLKKTAPKKASSR